jgi:hypothetical protein
MRATALAGALATCALALAACGDDDEAGKTTTGGATEARTTAQVGPLEDVEPRAARPNIVGGDAPLAEFATRTGDDAVNYFEEVFAASGVPYAVAEIDLVEGPREVCGQPFDPEQYLIYRCASPTSTLIALSGPRLERIRAGGGDAAVAFIAGFAVAIDASDQIVTEEGGPPPPPDELARQNACFVGAWIRNVGERRLLEAGDDKEIATAAVQMVSPQAPRSALEAVQDGYDQGIARCRASKGETP